MRNPAELLLAGAVWPCPPHDSGRTGAAAARRQAAVLRCNALLEACRCACATRGCSRQWQQLCRHLRASTMSLRLRCRPCNAAKDLELVEGTNYQFLVRWWLPAACSSCGTCCACFARWPAPALDSALTQCTPLCVAAVRGLSDPRLLAHQRQRPLLRLHRRREHHQRAGAGWCQIHL